jgi:pyruvate formate lyase activating enzyme
VAVNPIYGITPFSLLDYKDYTSCIVWFSRCNMKCLYCYNPELVFGKGVYDYQYVLDFLDKRKGLLDGVVLSGGECTIHSNFYQFVQAIKSRGYKVKIDTNGLRPLVIGRLIKNNLVDFISLDFKTHQTDFEDLTGSKKFSQFEKTLEILLESKNAFEVRSTIHSELIRPKDLEKMIQFLREKRYKQPYYLQPYRNGVKTLTELQSSIISEEFKQIVSADFDIIWRE